MCLETGMRDLRSRFKGASAKPINSPELRHRKVLEVSSFTDPFFQLSLRKRGVDTMVTFCSDLE
jgi:hypothetical protein